MLKLDLSKVPVVLRAVYPGGFLDETAGYEGQRAGECARFKAGVANGHAFENRSDAAVVLFEIGTRTQNETVHYPDVDLRFERRDGVRHFVHKDGTPYD